MIIGLDLGVRSIHVSMEDTCKSLVVKRSERWKELTELQELYSLLLDELESEYSDSTIVYMEEPVLAGARNLRVFMAIAQVSGMILSSDARTELVPVTTWKKNIVGHAFAKKYEIAEWLSNNNPYEFELSVQDHVDATCIRLYGELMEKQR